jgi:hypothetical protein
MTAEDDLAQLLADLVRDRPGSPGLQATAYTAAAAATSARVRTNSLKAIARDKNLNPDVRDQLLADRNAVIRAAVWQTQPWEDAELLAQVAAATEPEILTGIIRRADISAQVAAAVVAKASKGKTAAERAPLWAGLRNTNLPAAVAPDAFAATVEDLHTTSTARYTTDVFSLLDKYDVAVAVAADPRVVTQARMYAASRLHGNDALQAVRDVTEMVKTSRPTDPLLRLDLDRNQYAPTRWENLLRATNEAWVAAAPVHEAVIKLIEALVEAGAANEPWPGLISRHADLSAEMTHPARVAVRDAVRRDAAGTTLGNFLASAPDEARLYDLFVSAVSSRDLNDEQFAVRARYVPDTSEDAVAEALAKAPSAELPGSALARYPQLWAHRVLVYMAFNGDLKLPTDPALDDVVEYTIETFLANPDSWPSRADHLFLRSGRMTPEQVKRLPSDLLLSQRSRTQRPSEAVDAMTSAFAEMGQLPAHARATALKAVIDLLDSRTPLVDIVESVCAAS